MTLTARAYGAPQGEPGKRITILSIDGGGVRGIIPSTILEFLESALQKLDGPSAALADYFDVISGTSTGGLVTALLTVPDENSRPKYSAKQITDIYLNDAATIFPPVSSWRWFAGWFRPRYDGKGLIKVTEKLVGNDVHLKDTLTNVVIPSFDIMEQQPVFFNNLDAKKNPLLDPRIAEVTRGTSAAPTYLPAVRFTINPAIPGMPPKVYNLVDGGVVCNNPTHVAIVQAIKEVSMSDGAYSRRLTKWGGYEDLLVLSLGTGETPVSYDAEKASKWGCIGWIYDRDDGTTPIINLYSNGSAYMVDYNVSIIFNGQGCPDNYLRIQTDLKGNMGIMDDATPKNMQYLHDLGKRLLKAPATLLHPITGNRNEYGDSPTNEDILLIFAAELSKEKKKRKNGNQ